MDQILQKNFSNPIKMEQTNVFYEGYRYETRAKK